MHFIFFMFFFTRTNNRTKQPTDKKKTFIRTQTRILYKGEKHRSRRSRIKAQSINSTQSINHQLPIIFPIPPSPDSSSSSRKNHPEIHCINYMLFCILTIIMITCLPERVINDDHVHSSAATPCSSPMKSHLNILQAL